MQGKVKKKWKAKNCQKELVPCKSMQKSMWLNSWKNYSEISRKKSCSKIFRKTCMVVTVIPRHTKADSIADVFLRIFWNYLQLLLYPWDNCDQLSVKIPPPLRSNGSPFLLVMRSLMRWFIVAITVNKP